MLPVSANADAGCASDATVVSPIVNIAVAANGATHRRSPDNDGDNRVHNDT
jgi:hypothetical protein